MLIPYLPLIAAFWASTASCGTQEQDQAVIRRVGLPPVTAWDSFGPTFEPYPSFSKVNLTSSRLDPSLPSPCQTGESFAPPRLEIANSSIEIWYENDDWYGVSHGYDLNLTIRDAANGYNILCKGDGMDPGTCSPEGDVEVDTFSTRYMMLNKRMNDSYDEPYATRLSVSQIWVCDQPNNTYPYIYEAFAEAVVETDCVRRRNITDGRYPCSVVRGLPLSIETNWFTPENDTQLTPRPVSGPEPPAPAPARPGRTKDCTSRSFTTADIIMDDFHFVPPPTNQNATSDSLNFTLTSLLTGTRALCVPSAEQDDRYATRLIDLDCTNEESGEDDPYQTQSEFYDVSFWHEERNIAFNQKWLCGDPEGGRETEFDVRVVGTSVPYYCSDPSDDGTRICNSSRKTYQATMQKPVPNLVPAPPPPPPNTDTPGCTVISERDPRWLLDDLVAYHVWFDAHIDPGSGTALRWSEHSLTVNIRNTMNDYNASCVITNRNTPEYNAETWFPCFAETERHTFPKYTLETWVKFDMTRHHFSFNQTWFCNDTEEGIPLEFKGKGDLTFGEYECAWMNISQHYDACPGTSDPWGMRPPWQCDPEWDIQWCNISLTYPYPSAAPFPIYGNVIEQIELPGDAFTDPEPDPYPDVYSCTAASSTEPIQITLTNITSRTEFMSLYEPNNTRTSVRFMLDNSALMSRPGYVSMDAGGGGHELTPYLATHDAGHVYTAYKRNFLNDLGWYVRFDLSQGYVELNQTWYCEERDPQHPVLFNATWNGFLPFSCGIERAGEDEDPRFDSAIVCNVEGDGGVVTLIPSVMSHVEKEPIPDPTCPPPDVCPYPRDPNSDDDGVILN
ncbi:hypothetical protein GGR52DRAFT_585442 [Hypoxylon sp. FL1284]|nr:hypothetical protein GGR52DRAFT_585442 [Hypoxylon sp. FL1284]